MVKHGKDQNQEIRRPRRYTVLTGLAAVAVFLAFVTLLPRDASEPDLMGLRTVCAFAPGSTLLLLGLALFFRMLRDAIYQDSAAGSRRASTLQAEPDGRNKRESPAHK